MALLELVHHLQDIAENVVEATSISAFTLDQVRDLVKTYTATHGRSIVITDSFTVDSVLSTLCDLIVRGAITIFLIDVTGNLPRAILHHIPIVETYVHEKDKMVELVKYALELGEALEQITLIRVPYSIIKEGFAKSKEIEKLIRIKGTFYRNWKYVNAWLAGEIVTRLAFKQEADKLRKLIVEESIRLLEKHVTNRENPTLLALGWLAYENAKSRGENVLGLRLYSIDSINDIILRAREVLNICELYVSDEILYEKCKNTIQTVLTQPTADSIETYVRDFMRCSVSNTERSILAAALRVARSIQGPSIVLSNIRLFNIDSLFKIKGKYDIRSVSFFASDLSELADMYVSTCSPDVLKVLEDRLPEDHIMICVQDDPSKLSLEDLRKLSNLSRSIIVTRYDEVMFELLKKLGISVTVFDIETLQLRYLSGEVMRNIRVVLVPIPVKARIIVRLEYCDGCGECSRAKCEHVTLAEGKVKISSEICSNCCACVLLCTRGALAIEEVL